MRLRVRERKSMVSERQNERVTVTERERVRKRERHSERACETEREHVRDRQTEVKSTAG